MDIETFLQMRPTWAYQPCLYIVKQMFPGNNAYRCGAAGTQLFRQADPVYGADRTGSLTGLLGRMTMYKNYWLPLLPLDLHADTLAMTESSHAPLRSIKSGWSLTHSMGKRPSFLFYLQEIFSAECHISKTMHTCASPLVGVMAELSKPMTAMLHPLLS